MAAWLPTGEQADNLTVDRPGPLLLLSSVFLTTPGRETPRTLSPSLPSSDFFVIQLICNITQIMWGKNSRYGWLSGRFLLGLCVKPRISRAEGRMLRVVSFHLAPIVPQSVPTRDIQRRGDTRRIAAGQALDLDRSSWPGCFRASGWHPAACTLEFCFFASGRQEDPWLSRLLTR